MNRWISILLGIGVMAAFPSSLLAADAKEKGTEIGTIISTAIDTALPGLSKLTETIAAIFKPKEKEKTELDAEVKKATAEFEAQVKKNVAAIQPLSAQLAAIGPFLEYGFRASVTLSSMITFLAEHPNMAASDWQQVQADWAEVSQGLKQIPFTTQQLHEQVSDDRVEEVLLGILTARDVTGAGISILVNSKSSPSLLAGKLKELVQALSTLQYVSRIQLNNLNDQIDALVQWSKGKAQGSATAPTAHGIKEDEKLARELLQTAAKT
jgi:hypothetical protein